MLPGWDPAVSLPTTPKLKAAGYSPDRGSLLPDVQLTIVVDGTRIRTAGNVSEAYNDMFRIAVRTYNAQVVTLPAVLSGSSAGGFHGVFVLFEPKYMAPSLLLALQDTLRRCKSTVVVVSDDVWSVPQAENAARALGNVLLLTPYPELFTPTYDVVVHWPHACPAAFLNTTIDASPRVRRCVVAGQSGRAQYPLRHAVREAAVTDPSTFLDLGAPSYSSNTRIPPETLARFALASTCAFVGGGVKRVPVSKHFEFAACGCIVLTDPVSAERMAALGVACIGVESVDAARRVVETYVPGEHEERNVEVIRCRHTVAHRVQALYVLAVAAAHGVLTPREMARASAAGTATPCPANTPT